MDKKFISLVGIFDEGETLEFTDGSLFRVDPFDLQEMKDWSVDHEIDWTVTQDRVFNYTFFNLDNDVWVRAMKLN